VRAFAVYSVSFSLMLVATPPLVQAQQKLAKLVPFRRVDADPNKTYTLAIGNGPWMVLAASFAGENAKKEAGRLVLELRKRFHVPAYVHEKRYDFTESVQGLGLNKYGEPKKMKYRQSLAFDEVAVLVGDYPSINDSGLQKTLNSLKFAPLKSVKLDRNSHTGLRFAGLRDYMKKINVDTTKRRKGLMGSAFITRNPLLPKEYFAPRGIDRVVASMNDGVKHSLLNCPGKYTVRVATFRGNVIIDQKRVSEIEMTGKMETRLAEAAEKAHFLTSALRKRGIEAYEFHDRHESMVTVGSFTSVGSPRKDGKTEINPTVLKIMTDYGAHRQPLPGQQAGLVPRSLNGISFDIQPTPVEVPSRSIAADYVRH
jgi:hypothetical protein